ncbi:MAG: oligosaccharide flippase family protein [Patescibacteria group bacterium]
MDILRDRIVRLLRWSEKYMKTDMLYLAKGSFWLMVGQGVSMVSGLLLAVAFANLLPKEVYGDYKYILSLAGILAAFSLSGMGIAVTQAVARGFEGMIRTGFWVQLKWSVLVLLAALVGATYYFIQNNWIVAISFLIAGALLPIIESTSLYSSFLGGKKDFQTDSIYGIFRSVVPAIALLGTILITRNVIVIVLAYFLSHAATSSILYLRTLQKYKPGNTVDYSNISYGKHVSVLNIISIIVFHADKVLIYHYLGAVPLAIYSIGFSLPAQLKVVSKMLTTLIFPKLSSSSLETIRATIYDKSLRIFLAYAVIIAAYIAAAPFVFRWIFPQYLDAVTVSQALALGYLFHPAVLFSQTMFAQKRQRELYILKFFVNGSRIILLLLLLPPYGVWGAVYAFILGNALSSAASIILFRRLRE